MKRHKCFTGYLAILALMGSLMAGCGWVPPPRNALEEDYGMSVANNKARQIVNPRAALQVEATVGQPPRAAANNMEAYDKSFLPSERKGTTLKLTTEK
jgi:hypothetical protein